MQKHWFLKRWFLQGLVISLPIIITAIVFFYCISYADIILAFAANLLPASFPKPIFPGMGLIIVSVLLILIGALTETYLVNKLVQIFNFLMSKLPFVRSIYTTALKVVQNFLGSSNKFSKVVLIEYPHDGVYALAFKTNEAPNSLCELVGKKMVSVFIPTTPNPIGGFHLMIPVEKVKETDLRPEEALKLILSAGIVDE